VLDITSYMGKSLQAFLCKKRADDFGGNLVILVIDKSENGVKIEKKTSET